MAAAARGRRAVRILARRSGRLWRWWTCRDGVRRPRGARDVLEWLTRGIVGIVAASIAVVLLLAVVPPPVTAFMLQARWLDRDDTVTELRYDWVPGSRISPELALAVVAAEDQRFPSHLGFDLTEIHIVLEEEGAPARGASTLTQQVAKNLFLWPGGWVRKGLEAYWTVLLEAVWTKRRILVVYMNVAEFGPGVYGAEAASRTYFGKAASDLSRDEASLLAAVLPNPRGRSVTRPSAYVLERAAEIRSEMDRLAASDHLADVW